MVDAALLLRAAVAASPSSAERAGGAASVTAAKGRHRDTATQPLRAAPRGHGVRASARPPPHARVNASHSNAISLTLQSPR
jgi:hypothetical protein